MRPSANGRQAHRNNKKYLDDAVVLNLDALPNLVIEEAVSEKDDADKNIHENDIEPVKAA